MLDELQTWWQNTTPEMQANLQDGGLAVGALLGGHVVGAMVARALRARNFNAALRLPGSSPGADADHGITASFVLGMLVRLTVWAGAAWWLAHKRGMDDLANTLGLVITRGWALATVLVVALGLGSLLARRLTDCLQGNPRTGSEGLSRNGVAASRWNVAGALGAGIYLLVVLVALLIAADLFDWPLTRTSAQALWQLSEKLLVAAAALFIGSFGASRARELAASEGSAGQYTALGIMAATTLLAVTVLLSSAGMFLSLLALAVIGVLLWFGRGYLPDVTAGLQLRAQKVRDAWLDGALWQVAEVGFLRTQLCRAGEFCQLQNRRVLDASAHGAPVAAGQR